MWRAHATGRGHHCLPFQKLPDRRCAGVMVSALIGVVMLTFFSTALQNGFFIALNALSEMAGNGSEIATAFSLRQVCRLEKPSNHLVG